MLALIEITAALELLLVILEGLIPSTRRYLPLGGSRLAQLGVLFATLLALIELQSGIAALAYQ